MTLRKLNILVMMSVVVITAVFVWGFAVPGTRALKVGRAEAAGRVASLKADQEQLGNLGEVYSQIVQMDKRVEDFHRMVPSERQFGEFLKSLSEELTRAKIDQNIVQQRPEQSLDDTRLPASLKVVRGTSLLPVEISVDTTFTQLFEFLKAVESLPRLSHVESLRIRGDESRLGRIHADIVLHTFYNPMSQNASSGSGPENPSGPTGAVGVVEKRTS